MCGQQTEEIICSPRQRKPRWRSSGRTEPGPSLHRDNAALVIDLYARQRPIYGQSGRTYADELVHLLERQHEVACTRDIAGAMACPSGSDTLPHCSRMPHDALDFVDRLWQHDGERVTSVDTSPVGENTATRTTSDVRDIVGHFRAHSREACRRFSAVTLVALDHDLSLASLLLLPLTPRYTPIMAAQLLQQSEKPKLVARDRLDSLRTNLITLIDSLYSLQQQISYGGAESMMSWCADVI